MTQKGLWNVAREKMLEDRGASPKEDGDQLRENKAMHEEKFLSSWLNMNKEAKEEESKSGKRDVEREEEKAVLKRRCVNPNSCDVCEDICFLEVSESFGDS